MDICGMEEVGDEDFWVEKLMFARLLRLPSNITFAAIQFVSLDFDRLFTFTFNNSLLFLC